MPALCLRRLCHLLSQRGVLFQVKNCLLQIVHNAVAFHKQRRIAAHILRDPARSCHDQGQPLRHSLQDNQGRRLLAKSGNALHIRRRGIKRNLGIVHIAGKEDAIPIVRKELLHLFLIGRKGPFSEIRAAHTQQLAMWIPDGKNGLHQFQHALDRYHSAHKENNKVLLLQAQLFSDRSSCFRRNRLAKPLDVNGIFQNMGIDRHLTDLLILPDDKLAYADHVAKAFDHGFLRDKMNMGMKHKLIPCVPLGNVKNGLFIAAFHKEQVKFLLLEHGGDLVVMPLPPPNGFSRQSSDR